MMCARTRTPLGASDNMSAGARTRAGAAKAAREVEKRHCARRLAADGQRLGPAAHRPALLAVYAAGALRV